MGKLGMVSSAWAVVLGIGLMGLFGGQTALMGVCFVAWTPVTIAFGFYLHKAGVRVSFGGQQDETPTRPPLAKPTPAQRPQQRVRKLS
jgi:hypothetical protein